MPVPIESDFDRRVPESFHHGLWMGTLGDEHRCTGVPQVMKAQAIGQSRPGDRRLEVAGVEEIVPQRGTRRTGEDEITGRRRMVSKVVGENFA